MHRRILALALAGATVAASAQILGAPPGTPEPHALPETPEWQEADAPAPPPLRTSGLIGIDVAGTSLHFGVDPASIAVGQDGVVRYVVVATSNTGAVNGLYEGIRCEAGDVKVYARYNPDSGWVRAQGSDWVPLNATPDQIARALTLLLSDGARRAAMAAAGPRLVDGKGASRIAADLAAVVNA